MCSARLPTARGLRNEAESYRNDIIPRARGDAVRIEQEAEAYRLATIARSQGDAARFLSVYEAYKVTQDVTLERLYLETMEEMLKNSNKVIIDKSAEGASGVLPYLPLPALGSGAKPGTAPTTNAPGAAVPGGGSAQSQPAVQSSDTAAPAPPQSNGQD